MCTMGFRFKPWKGEKLVAEGGAILEYLNEIADENSIKEKIQYHSHVHSVSWSSDESRWTVTYKNKRNGINEIITCDFLYFCAGYYDYDKAYVAFRHGQHQNLGSHVEDISPKIQGTHGADKHSLANRPRGEGTRGMARCG